MDSPGVSLHHRVCAKCRTAHVPCLFCFDVMNKNCDVFQALNEIVRMLDDAATGPVTFVIFRSVNDFFCSGLSIGSFCKRVDSGASQAVLAERYAKSLRSAILSSSGEKTKRIVPKLFSGTL